MKSMIGLSCLIGLVAAAGLALASSPEYVIETYDGNGFPQNPAYTVLTDHPTFVLISLPNSTRRVNIKPKPNSTDEIRRLEFTGQGLNANPTSSKIDFILGDGPIPSGVPNRPTPITTRINSVDASLLNSRFYGGAQGVGNGISVGELVYYHTV